MRVTAGAVFLEMLLIFTFIPLNASVQAAAIAEDATALTQATGTIFPYIWVFLIIALAGVIVYEMVLKK